MKTRSQRYINHLHPPQKKKEIPINKHSHQCFISSKRIRSRDPKNRQWGSNQIYQHRQPGPK